MYKIEDFKVLTDNGLSVFIDVGGRYYYDRTKNSKDIIHKATHSFIIGLSWSFNGRKVSINKKRIYKAYLSTNLRYVIAIYSGDQAEYTPPNNAIIYNADGSIHKVLKVPLLVSDAAKNQGWYKRQPDTTIGFTGVDWKTDSKGKKVVVMEISDHYYKIMKEYRVLDPETGEFGECIDSRIEYK